ncbi:hypothetical protein Tco_0227203 [Tanacetum coccineum]
MAALKFAETHNLVAFLEKPDESDGLKQIVDFLNAHTIKYALTINTTIYTSCIEQFWATAKVKTINEEKQLQALVDKKKVIITESTIRRDLHLEDVEEPIADEATNEENVPTHSNDPLFSAEDRVKLNELMKLCTTLQSRVLDLETTKTAKEKEIASLKKRVKKLERKRKSKTPRMKRLFKFGRSAQVVSSEDEGLGAQEDASKQGRKIADIDADVEVTLLDETQGRNDDNLMCNTCVLDEEEVEVEKVVSIAEVTTDSATATTVDELTLAQTLTEIKVAKPKVRGVMIQEPSEFTTTTTTTTPAASKPSQDKGKEKMIEYEKPLKKKDQIMYDQEAQEQKELTIEEKLRLFVELMDKRKKHFAKLRAE